MHDSARLLVPGLVGIAEDLEREFGERLAESSTLAYRVAWSVLRHPQDAEDVAQEAFTKAYRSFRSLRDRQRFRSWLIRTTWRTALDRQRANRRRGSHEVAVDAATLAQARDGHGASGDASVEVARALWTAIDALPDKLRVVIVLASIEGHDVREVSRLLEIPEGTVKSRLFLARGRLKEALR